jgi:kinesin family protein 4/21/27
MLNSSMLMDTSGMMGIDEETGSLQELLAKAKKDVESQMEEASKKKRKISKTAGNNNAATADEDKDADSADDEDDEEEEEDSDVEADSDDSDTDTEGSGKDGGANSEFNEELVELTSEISMKQKLIEELETSQKRLQSMKNQYENKLVTLQNRIVTTEEERDKVLKNMGTSKSALAPEKVDKIRKDYKEKLERLQGEVKKLQTAKKEHAKLLRSQGQYERQVDKLKNEVGDMKRIKVRLVQKMKEESSRHRDQELRKNKEIGQMKKATRKHESKIKVRPKNGKRFKITF